jgi:hypothetical protein
MSEAVSAINLAGQLAPEDKFVQCTAGEIVAWYEVKADKSAFSESAKAGLANVRSLLEKEVAYTGAYEAAVKAYQSQASSTPSTPMTPGQSVSVPQAQNEQPDAVAPASANAETQAPPIAYAYPPPDFSAYYYDWGPGWVEPAPWCWRWPAGYFGGLYYYPFGAFVVFENDDFFHHHHDFHHGHDGHSVQHGDRPGDATDANAPDDNDSVAELERASGTLGCSCFQRPQRSPSFFNPSRQFHRRANGDAFVDQHATRALDLSGAPFQRCIRSGGGGGMVMSRGGGGFHGGGGR